MIINDHVNCWEAKMQILEELDITHNTEQGREELNRAQSEYARWLASQEVLLKQKSHFKWLKEGNCDNKYFHAIIKNRRRKLHLHRIKNHKGA